MKEIDLREGGESLAPLPLDPPLGWTNQICRNVVEKTEQFVMMKLIR